MTRIERYKIEQEEGWQSVGRNAPWISFPADIQIKIIPPFSGAMARFLAKKGEKEISVYLDTNDALGYFGRPYWEIYPYKDDTYRVPMEDTKLLIEKVQEALQ